MSQLENRTPVCTPNLYDVIGTRGEARRSKARGLRGGVPFVPLPRYSLPLPPSRHATAANGGGADAGGGGAAGPHGPRGRHIQRHEHRGVSGPCRPHRRASHHAEADQWGEGAAWRGARYPDRHRTPHRSPWPTRVQMGATLAYWVGSCLGRRARTLGKVLVALPASAPPPIERDTPPGGGICALEKFARKTGNSL